MCTILARLPSVLDATEVTLVHANVHVLGAVSTVGVAGGTIRECVCLADAAKDQDAAHSGTEGFAFTGKRDFVGRVAGRLARVAGWAWSREAPRYRTVEFVVAPDGRDVVRLVVLETGNGDLGVPSRLDGGKARAGLCDRSDLVTRRGVDVSRLRIGVANSEHVGHHVGQHVVRPAVVGELVLEAACGHQRDAEDGAGYRSKSTLHWFPLSLQHGNEAVYSSRRVASADTAPGNYFRMNLESVNSGSLSL